MNTKHLLLEMIEKFIVISHELDFEAIDKDEFRHKVDLLTNAYAQKISPEEGYTETEG